MTLECAISIPIYVTIFWAVYPTDPALSSKATWLTAGCFQATFPFSLAGFRAIQALLSDFCSNSLIILVGVPAGPRSSLYSSYCTIEVCIRSLCSYVKVTSLTSLGQQVLRFYF